MEKNYRMLRTKMKGAFRAVLLLFSMLAPSCASAQKVTVTEFDPNFHIYLCFGQSNMEGNAAIELQDKKNVDKRFRMMAAVNMDNLNRKQYEWYVATPPLCRSYTGLTPADYFGRTMVENLPDSIKVGVINVAVGGASIKLYDEDICASYIAGEADWFKNYCKEYNNNPFRRLVNCAKKAQEVGVIKGILFHQGCTDNGQRDWPVKVKRVYQRLLKELNLKEEETPLLVGEMLEKGVGICSGHNDVIAKITTTIPNAYVISSKGCPGASDGLHFTAEGYRMIGKRYAETMLKHLDEKKEIDFDYSENMFPIKGTSFNPSLCYFGTYSGTASIGTFKSGGPQGFGGWRYSKGVDLSAFNYLVVNLGRGAAKSAKVTVRLYDVDDYLCPCYKYEMGTDKDALIDLHEMTNDNGEKVDPTHIYMIGVSAEQDNTVYIKSFFLSDDGQNPTIILPLEQEKAASTQFFDLMGRPVFKPNHGVYVKGGRKVLLK